MVNKKEDKIIPKPILKEAKQLLRMKEEQRTAIIAAYTESKRILIKEAIEKIMGEKTEKGGLAESPIVTVEIAKEDTTAEEVAVMETVIQEKPKDDSKESEKTGLVIKQKPKIKKLKSTVIIEERGSLPGRKIHRIELTELPLSSPEDTKKTLSIIAEEDKDGCVVVKGGIARLMALLEISERKNIVDFERRMMIEKIVNDLDIIVLHWETLPKSKEFLTEVVKNIREKLLCQGICLDPEDIEPIRTNGSEEKTIGKIIYNRDLTINQVCMKFENGVWVLYYTPQCYRHLIKGIGMLGKKDKGTLRLDMGRLMPTPYGLFGLLKFWIEGKVHSIKLPLWMLKAYIEEMKRIGETCPLGTYGVFLSEKYASHPEFVKARWMTALRLLRLTNLSTFEEFSIEQHKLFKEKTGKAFELQSRSFEERLDDMIAQSENRLEAKKEKKEARDKCEHEVVDIVCNGCPNECSFEKCTKCTAYQKDTEHELPCNIAVNTGNEDFEFNRDIQFWYFPKVNGNEKR